MSIKTSDVEIGWFFRYGNQEPWYQITQIDENGRLYYDRPSRPDKKGLFSSAVTLEPGWYRCNEDGTPYKPEIKLWGWYKCVKQSTSSDTAAVVGNTIRIIPHVGDPWSLSYDYGEASKQRRGIEKEFFLNHYEPCSPPTPKSTIKNPTLSYKEPVTVSVDYWPDHW